MINNFSDVEIIARTLFGEARGEVEKVGVIALEAIASVIWNRWVKNPKQFGESPREVCLKPYQFSCWNTNDPNLKLLLQLKINHDAYSLCYMISEEFMAGRGCDVTNGSDHYHSRWIQPPNWAVGRMPVMEIGNHYFYRL